METDGDLVEEYNYDAWGKRRNPNNWSYTNVPAVAYTNRGFTGHEHLDMFNLINMNGRVYDSEIARFVSPDPIIQDPYNIISYNRYTYCLNNPLKYTDPSGYLYNPGFNPRLWQLIVTLWSSTSEGQDRDYTSNSSGGWQGRRVSGHWEREMSVPKGGIHGNRLNNPNDPNNIDEITVTEKWVWDKKPLFTISFNRGIPEIETSFSEKDWGAITPGPFIIYPKDGSKDPYYNTHEPGHVIQFLILGPINYYKFIAIPSLITSTTPYHSDMPWEKSANQLWYWLTGEYDPRNPLYFGPKKKK
jgi:RHS repeat-associated protein